MSTSSKNDIQLVFNGFEEFFLRMIMSKTYYICRLKIASRKFGIRMACLVLSFNQSMLCPNIKIPTIFSAVSRIFRTT